MSRVIEFRAWDTETNEYFEPAYEAWRGQLNELVIKLNGRITQRTITEFIDESMFPGRFIYEQYTGLEDKNGKKIFEGDVFKMADPKQLYDVVWVDTGFMGKQRGCYGSYVGLSHWLSRIEVIATIHDTQPAGLKWGEVEE